MLSRRRVTILAAAFLFVGATIAVYLCCRPATKLVDDNNPPVRNEPATHTVPQVISVQAVYPGADAQTIAATVAAPMEEQINGVEHLLSISSQSSNDGSYTLHITFAAGTDLDQAQRLVQERVNRYLDLPSTPALVRAAGVAVRKTALQPLVLVSLSSPDQRYDELYLSKYASLRVKDELARLPGVADIALIGQRDEQMRLVLKPDELAARHLTVQDVVIALRKQHIQVTAGPLDPQSVPQTPQSTLSIQSEHINAAQLDAIVVKNAGNGKLVYLRDVATLQMGSTERSSARFNGKPAVVVAIYPIPNAKPSEVSRAIHDKLAELRTDVPAGLTLAVAFDFASNLETPNNPADSEHLVIDVALPESASAARTLQTLEQAMEEVRKEAGVQEVLALTTHPFSPVRNRPCLVVRLTSRNEREQVAARLRTALQNYFRAAVFRLSVPTPEFPVYGFPIEFVITDHGAHGSAALRECTDALVEKMSQSGKFTDVGVASDSRIVPVLILDIDRTRCQSQGVEINVLLDTLQVYLGHVSFTDYNPSSMKLQFKVPEDRRSAPQSTDILMLKVKNKQNQPVVLSTVMSVSPVIEPMCIERHNLFPGMRITATLTPGTPPEEAQALCERLAEQHFGTKQFKLRWRSR